MALKLAFVCIISFKILQCYVWYHEGYWISYASPALAVTSLAPGSVEGSTIMRLQCSWHTPSKTSVCSLPVQVGILMLNSSILNSCLTSDITGWHKLGSYDIIDMWYHMPMISCNTNIIDSKIWYHGFDSMIPYMILHMIIKDIWYHAVLIY